MMKNLTFLILALIWGVAVSAQAPQSFRYQAVARDNSGNVLADKAVSFRISILKGSASGSTANSETHSGTTKFLYRRLQLHSALFGNSE